MSTAIRIGSRDSQLALVQSHWVRGELQKIYPDYEFPLMELKTQGDKILDVALAKIGDKGLFTKELEVSMLEGTTDFAVHSLKDLPTELPEGLTLAVVTERENPADALVLHSKHKGQTLDTLTKGTVLGTSSLRRLAQLRHHYPHLVFKDIRGNLNTRLRKLDAGEFDGIVLAVAGLQRLGWADRIDQVIPGDISLHAVGQGALGIECRAVDQPLIELLQVLNHRSSEVCCRAERAMLRSLEGGCQVPIGVSTSLAGETLTLEGMVASLDGKTLIRDTKQGLASDPEALGRALAESLKDQGASEILANIRL
ncbi:MAG: hydroxymethylbilane synthase [Gloeobacterales cyanobacterium]